MGWVSSTCHYGSYGRRLCSSFFDNFMPLFVSSSLDLITFMDKPQFQFIAQLILLVELNLSIRYTTIA